MLRCVKEPNHCVNPTSFIKQFVQITANSIHHNDLDAGIKALKIKKGRVEGKIETNMTNEYDERHNYASTT